jgi:hypothetical protein
MGLLNYTTKISADKTAGEIQQLLAKAGADSILMAYENGETVGLRFQIQTSFGRQTFALPVVPDPVYKVLLKQSQPGAKNPVPRSAATIEQARRVAWRITKDWILAQLAIIETQMVSLEQVMLPYMETEQGTVFEAVKQKHLALPNKS